MKREYKIALFVVLGLAVVGLVAAVVYLATKSGSKPGDSCDLQSFITDIEDGDYDETDQASLITQLNAKCPSKGGDYNDAYKAISSLAKSGQAGDKKEGDAPGFLVQVLAFIFILLGVYFIYWLYKGLIEPMLTKVSNNLGEQATALYKRATGGSANTSSNRPRNANLPAAQPASAAAQPASAAAQPANAAAQPANAAQNEVNLTRVAAQQP